MATHNKRFSLIELRTFAFIIDISILTILSLACFFFTSSYQTITEQVGIYSVTYSIIVFPIAVYLAPFVISFVLFVLVPTFLFDGKTVGQKMLRIQVYLIHKSDTSESTYKSTKHQFRVHSIRWLLLFIDCLFLGAIGYFFMQRSPQCQRLGDEYANTVVKRTQKLKVEQFQLK